MASLIFKNGLAIFCIAFMLSDVANGQNDSVRAAPFRGAATGNGETPPRPLFVMNRDGTGLTHVATVEGKYACGSPSWSPGGKAIAFDAHGPGFSAQHLYIVDLESGTQTDVGDGGFPSWSPDGKVIAYHKTGNHGTHPPEIWLVDADGRNARMMFEEASHPRWSPDGTQIAYLTHYGQSAGHNLGIFDVKASERRELFDEPSRRLFWGQSWSPDGKRLSMIWEGEGGSHELVILNVQGSSRGLRMRYRGHMSSHTNWSSDGKHVLVGLYGARNGPRHLHYLNPDGREAPVPLAGQDPKLDYCDGAWSPDATRVAFSLTPNVRAVAAPGGP